MNIYQYLEQLQKRQSMNSDFEFRIVYGENHELHLNVKNILSLSHEAIQFIANDKHTIHFIPLSWIREVSHSISEETRPPRFHIS